ncbi:MAG: glycosyltransferase family 2 protein [Oligoflexia bacterium]|nr:glycosyltransferase family 2 protein [Oligoflexia bacterium]MBF0367738.1 glycosyltransferase family 2 protein [Oligoflexia bacterium]
MLTKNKPTVSGFTFIKNGLSLGYPILESIQSISELCDEVIISVGFAPNSTQDDGTEEYLRSHLSASKYKFIRSTWDPQTIAKGQGLILSEQTNVALRECHGKYCQYIQADEVVHENDLPLIEDGIKKLEASPKLHALIFNYLHFYGNVDVLKHTRNTYRREIRTIRNHQGIISWLDAQGFRFQDGRKIPATLLAGARIFHYGWCRQEMIMNSKIKAMDILYHDQDQLPQDPRFKYERIWGLRPFTESHPQIMKEWIALHRNQVDIFSLPIKFEWKNLGLAAADFIESLTDYRLGEYKGYIIR